MKHYRDEMIISTKAGYVMWEGPYGDKGSRKYLTASLDQSLSRMKLDYVDIFYHHRPDDETPLEETMDTISDLIHQGKALYAGISNYKSEKAKEAAEILKRNRTPLLINQFRYNMFDRWSEEDGLLETLEKVVSGSITFSPLAQGLLSDKYLNGIAKERGQPLSQMALCWNLRSGGLTSVLIGAHSPEQIEENVKIVEKLAFSSDELDAIEGILGGG